MMSRLKCTPIDGRNVCVIGRRGMNFMDMYKRYGRKLRRMLRDELAATDGATGDEKDCHVAVW